MSLTRSTSVAPAVPSAGPVEVVPSCHTGGDGRSPEAGAPVVALVGAPNAGKSTLFNSLTGGHRSIGNWPGSTVEVGRASWLLRDEQNGRGRAAMAVNLLDLPGAYSLDVQSPDEQLTRDLLLTGAAGQRPDIAVVVVDAAHLSRSLYLVAQLREHAQRVVVALTMVDVARRRGVTVEATALSQALGVPVVELDPRQRTGIPGLAAVVEQTLTTPVAVPRQREEMAGSELDEPDELDVADERFGWISAAVERAATVDDDVPATPSDRIDRVVTAPVVGPLLFLAVMWGVFQLTTTVAGPLQDGLGYLVSGPLTGAGRWLFQAVGLGGSWVEGFALNGLVAGVGMLLTFVPLMAIMFLLLALLEDSGYMARAAVVTDRMMRVVGLPGRAFLPLVVGFGCNVPAISATRVLPNARHRVMTALLVPFTSCSARLTVYVLVARTFFPDHAGTVVFGMYLASIALIVLTGLAMKATLWRAVGDEPLILDLPAYQRPTLRLTASVTWLRVKGFLHTASGIIVATVTAVWVLQAIPVGAGLGSFGHVAPQHSVFAWLAKLVAPVFAPAGFGDWHTSSALVVGFVAKEAVITSWAQTYAAADPMAGLAPTQLQHHITAAFAASSGGAMAAAVLAFLVFLLAYTPCVATLAAQRREIGVRWTAFGVGLQLSVAWVLAVAVFQVGRLL